MSLMMSPSDPMSSTLVGKTVLSSEHLRVGCSVVHFCNHEVTNSWLGFEAESGSSGRTGNCPAKGLAGHNQPLHSTETMEFQA